MKLTSLQARQPGGITLPVFVDLTAVQRNKSGDFYNSMSVEARDSSIVLGRVYAPPGSYNGVDFAISPSGDLFGGIGVTVVRNGFQGFIPVFIPPQTEASQLLPKTGQPPFSIVVETDRKTVVTVTMNLDSSLVRRTEDFVYRPYFYVSSSRTF
jgi:hypothetical protein